MEHVRIDDVVQRWDLPHGDTSVVLPDRTIESVLEEAGDRDDPHRRAAALLRNLANAHVFEGGNKRTSWVLARTYLLRQGLTVEPSGERAATVIRSSSDTTSTSWRSGCGRVTSTSHGVERADG